MFKDKWMIVYLIMLCFNLFMVVISAITKDFKTLGIMFTIFLFLLYFIMHRINDLSKKKYKK